MALFRFPAVPAEQASMVSESWLPGWSSPASWVPLVGVVGLQAIVLLLTDRLLIPAGRVMLTPSTEDRDRQAAARVVELVTPVVLAAIAAGRLVGVTRQRQDRTRAAGR